jgi:hypothetical protein
LEKSASRGWINRRQPKLFTLYFCGDPSTKILLSADQTLVRPRANFRVEVDG